MCCRWGPNHAADPIVTRWQRGEDGQVVSDKGTGKQVNKQNICLVAHIHLKSRCSSLLPSRGKIQELGLFQGAWSTQERRYLRVINASTDRLLFAFVNACQKVSVTVKREFMEEALDSTGAAKVNAESSIISEYKISIIPDIHCNSENSDIQENVGALTEMVDKFFEGGEEVYRS